MNILELEKLGGLVSEEPVVQRVTWDRIDNGEQETVEFDVGVIRLSFTQIEKIQRMEAGRNKNAELIALCIKFGDGSGRYEQKLSYEQACRIEPTLALQLSYVIVEVNNLEQKTKK
jgi:hypothetical protein